MGIEVKEYTGDAAGWNKIIAHLPEAHALQTYEWGQVKSRNGWMPSKILWQHNSGGIAAAALVLTKTLSVIGFPSRFSVIYIPKGPLLNWEDDKLCDQVIADLTKLARLHGAIFIKIDPDVRLGIGIPGQPNSVELPAGQIVVEDLKRAGWIFSTDQIQFRNTVLLDISPDLDVVLAKMKQKTRYNIHLAERKGIKIRMARMLDLRLLFRMYAETADRDGFVIRDEAYYQHLWETFFQANLAEAMIAELESEPVGALIYFYLAGRAWYMSGMSTSSHREKMPNHLLQWKAICRLKELGVKTYDLWGAPDDFTEDDPMWGVYRFKEGLGGRVVRHLGAWDFPICPGLYKLYTQVLPLLLDVMRKRGILRTHKLVEQTEIKFFREKN